MLANSVDESQPALAAIAYGLATLGPDLAPARPAVTTGPSGPVAAGHTLADRGWIGLTCPSSVDTGQVRIHAALSPGYPDTRVQDAWSGKESVRAMVAFLTNDVAAVRARGRLVIIGADVRYRPDTQDGSGPRSTDDGLPARSVAQLPPRLGTQRSARCRR